MTYPNGRVEDDQYNTALDAAISRPDALADATAPSVPLEAYAFLGQDTVVSRTQGDGDRLAYNLGTASNGSDRYTGLDTYGRVVDQDWVNASGTSVDRLQYGFDADGNVLYRNDTTNATTSRAFGEAYTNDGLNRLTGFARGTLSPTPTPTVTNPSASKTWALDALGNWTSTTTNGAAASPRTNNAANQVTAAGSASLTYDADGNALTDGSGDTLTYDAWNRPSTESGTTGSGGTSSGSGASTPYTVTYGYTAGQEQATRQLTAAGTAGPTELRYYDAAGRVVEEDHQTVRPPNTSSGSATVTTTVDDQYVWGLGYVNDLVERDAGGGRLYAMQDANYNVTAVANASGGVVERFAYDPYGAQTVLSASYAATTDAYGWQVGFQGGIADATTGLIRFGARDYSPTLGRWVEQDPAGYVDGSSRYQATDDNPSTLSDPSGLDPNPINPIIHLPHFPDLVAPGPAPAPPSGNVVGIGTPSVSIVPFNYTTGGNRFIDHIQQFFGGTGSSWSVGSRIEYDVPFSLSTATGKSNDILVGRKWVQLSPCSGIIVSTYQPYIQVSTRQVHLHFSILTPTPVTPPGAIPVLWGKAKGAFVGWAGSGGIPAVGVGIKILGGLIGAVPAGSFVGSPWWEDADQNPKTTWVPDPNKMPFSKVYGPICSK